jgi:hypothetical protein
MKRKINEEEKDKTKKQKIEKETEIDHEDLEIEEDEIEEADDDEKESEKLDDEVDEKFKPIESFWKRKDPEDYEFKNGIIFQQFDADYYIGQNKEGFEKTKGKVPVLRFYGVKIFLKKGYRRRIFSIMSC